jgi:hypothetical protein
VNVTEILAYNPALEIRLGRFEDFDTHPIDLDSDLLLAYPTNERFKEKALSKLNMAVLFA